MNRQEENIVEYRIRPESTGKRRRNIQAILVQAKAMHRKRNLILFYVSLFIVIITAAVTLGLTVWFPISQVEVTGDSRYSAEEIIVKSGILEGKNLFLLNKEQVIVDLKETLPYIGTVMVSRKLPGTVRIEVHDVKIAGTAAYNGVYLVIDTTGKVVEQLAEQPTNYTQITGLQIAGATVGTTLNYAEYEQEIAFKELLAALEESGLSEITELDVSNTMSLKAVYQNRVTMHFGIAADLPYKARFAKSLLETEKIQPAEKGDLDLSVVTDNNKVYFSPDYSVSVVEEQ